LLDGDVQFEPLRDPDATGPLSQTLLDGDLASELEQQAADPAQPPQGRRPPHSPDPGDDPLEYQPTGIHQPPPQPDRMTQILDRQGDGQDGRGQPPSPVTGDEPLEDSPDPHRKKPGR
jgi:hypothetical protein